MTRAIASAGVVESVALVSALRTVAAAGWAGTAQQLLEQLTAHVTAALASLGRPVTPEILGVHLRQLAPELQAAGVVVTFAREGHAGRRVIRLLTTPTNREPTGAVSPNGDGPADRPEPSPSQPPQSPPEAVSAPRDGAADPPPPLDADSAPADSQREASLVKPEPLSAAPPAAVGFDRAAYRTRIMDLFRRSNLYGVGIRDDPPAAAALIERLLDLMAGAQPDLGPAPSRDADSSPR